MSPSIWISRKAASSCAASRGSRKGERRTSRSRAAPGTAEVTSPVVWMVKASETGPTWKAAVRPAWRRRRSMAMGVERNTWFNAAVAGRGSILDLPAAVQRHHARGEVEVLDAREPGRFHHRLQLLLPGVHADRFGEVAVSGLVPGDVAPQPREHLERIRVVGARERLPGARELEHQHAPAGARHARHLGERAVL